MSEEQKEDFKVTEEKDGSVIVDLPAELAPEPEEEEKAAPVEAADDSDDDHPDDTEAVRAARRARRKAKKELIKKTNEEKDQRLQLLQRQNQELMERLANIERRANTADLARFGKAIEDEELRLNFALRKMKEATDNSDGQALIEAQKLWYETNKKLEVMKATKARAEQANNQPEAPNPKLQKFANQWMEKNSWYKKDGNDEDSAIAKLIDSKMADEGWDPTTEDYWEELDIRLRKRLPHRYTDEQDEQPVRRRPRSIVTGSSNESSGFSGNTASVVLSPEQVRAMKEAGFWEDPELRKRMIKRYALEARNNNRG